VLRGRRVLVGVTGGIAAYKSVYLVRRLLDREAEVRVMMTASAQEFVGAQTFAALTGHPVADRLFGEELVSPHTELAQWADLVIIAPATANTIAKAAHGLADDIVSATLLATVKPVLFAPAMHTEMWENAATQRNIEMLQASGHQFVGPETGALAGGDVGPGRMVEPEEILTALEASTIASLSGVHVLVTAGGTREPIDPVRYIANRSSGKMGFAVAAAATACGAEVTLISSAARPAPPGVTVIDVETAEEMSSAVAKVAPAVDAVVMAAAVADFRPAHPATAKLRRTSGMPSIELESTPDILAGLAAMDPRPYLIGFAAEVGSLDGAIEKARSKGVDVIVANDVGVEGSGFGTDTNQVTLIYPDGSVEPWPLLTKRRVAEQLCDHLAARLSAENR
jgi:phosphopantothenoylcysteine decarboxylase/phosphopantothenate--cysteine ligase